jgi:hypothetical protein
MSLMSVRTLSLPGKQRWLVGLPLALRSDEQRDESDVTALCPRFVRTPLLANLTDKRDRKVSVTPPKPFTATIHVPLVRSSDPPG